MLNEVETAQWYAVSTRCHHEKTAAKHLVNRAIEHFVPMYETVRAWKDRRKRMELPLFPGYIFVRILLQQRMSVLIVPGVVRLVGFDNQAAVLPDEEIERLRTIVSQRLHAEPCPYLAAGHRVRITRGALQGMEGVLVRKKGRLRLLLSINLIRQSALIEVDAADVATI
jgi:transcription antitermination factor NusG